MKNIAFLFLVTITALTFLSCATTSSKLNQMRKICVQIEESENLTEKDFEKLNTRFSEITTKLESHNLNDDEKDELSRLKGRYYGAITVKVAKNVKNLYDGFGNVLKGFVEGVNNSINK